MSVFPVLIILAVPLTLAVGQGVSARVLYGIGRLRSYTLVVLLEAFVNLALSLLLIGPSGIQGVALGTTIPNLMANLVIILYVCRILGVSLGEYLIVAWMKPLPVGGLLAIFWLQAERWIPLTSWGTFVTVGSIGVIGYATLAVLIEGGQDGLLAVDDAEQLQAAGGGGGVVGGRGGLEAGARRETSALSR